MSRKVKVMVSALVIALMAMLIPTTVVLAQEEEETATPPWCELRERLTNRVAEILEVSPEKLTAAVEQARVELREPCVVEREQLREQCRGELRQAVRQRLETRQADSSLRIMRAQRTMNRAVGFNISTAETEG